MAYPPTIHEGETGPVVRWAQYLLVRRTLSYTDIDGIFGKITKNAVEEFQRYNLVVDGIVGPATWAALGGDRPQPPTLQQGSNGNVVRYLQTALNEGRGDFSPNINPPLAVDGQFGPKTAAEVRGTQQMGGIAADGIVGLQTWALPVHAAGQVLADLCGVTGPGTS
jgi:murein L,D-transpeptidase YcbB/YkuD